MNNLTTRKIVFGMLMALVLTFSVQGIAEALTFSTSKTGDLETKAPNEQFTIRFSVSLKGNTAIRSGGNLVKDSTATGGAANARIDSSGYLVAEVDGREYRTITANPTGNLVVDPRPTYRDETPGTAGSPDGTYYVDTSGNVVDADGEAVYVQTGNGTKANNDDPNNPVAADPWRYTRAKADPNDKVDDLNRYHYNEETIKVDLTGDARIIRVGSRNVNLTATDDLDMYERTHPLYDSAAEHEKLSGSVSLVIEPIGTDGGVITVKVTDNTAANDFPAGGTSNPITFTLYSVKYQSGVTGNDNTTTLAGDGVGSAFDNDVRPLGSYFTFPGAEVPVHYSVDGSGTLSIRQVYGDGSPTSVKTASKTLSTSDNAPVFIDMRRGTNKVTAWVSGGTPKTMVFIYQGTTPAKYPEIEITQGNNQVGANGGLLEEPLGVKVTDGNRRPLSGVAVKFDTTGATANFIPVPDTRVYITGSGTTLALVGTLTQPPNDETYLATPTLPGEKTTPVFVQTDRSGVAKVYYELDSNTTQTITASLEGADFTVDTKFTARVGTAGSERVANLEILSGDPQSAAKGKNLADPLVVIARSTAGYRIPNVVIQFRASIGILSRHGLTTAPLLNGHDDDLDSTSLQWGEIPANTPNPDSGQQIYVRTGFRRSSERYLQCRSVCHRQGGYHRDPA